MPDSHVTEMIFERRSPKYIVFDRSGTGCWGMVWGKVEVGFGDGLGGFEKRLGDTGYSLITGTISKVHAKADTDSHM